MFSDEDLEGAVAAGVLSPAAVDAFRTHIASRRPAPAVDEEHFRLITGFNDIFVSIATVLVLFAAGWIGSDIAGPVGALAVAAVAWGLAEFFTRQLRMALPSIILLLAFVGSVFGAVAGLLMPHGMLIDGGDRGQALAAAVAAAVAAGAAWAHWRRFKVPITVAAGTAAGVVLALALLLTAVPQADSVLRILALVAGLAVFALAMRWDISDRQRETRRSDVAFWLHLLAAPLIVHPIFVTLGFSAGYGGSAITALVVVALYGLLGLVALAIDRRALMVSALAYVLAALTMLFRQFGAISLSLALTGLVIGSALLLLSAFWQGARAAVVARLSPSLRDRLPPVGRPVKVSPRPA